MGDLDKKDGVWGLPGDVAMTKNGPLPWSQVPVAVTPETQGLAAGRKAIETNAFAGPQLTEPGAYIPSWSATPSNTNPFSSTFDAEAGSQSGLEQPTKDNTIDFLKSIPENTGKFLMETAKAPVTFFGAIPHNLDLFATLPKAQGPGNALRTLGHSFRAVIGLPVSPAEEQALATDIARYHLSKEADPKLQAHLDQLLSDQPTEEQRKEFSRGAATIITAGIPLGKGAELAARAIPNLLVRKIAQAEMHSIASFAVWGAGQNIANKEPIQTGLGEQALLGAAMPGVGAIAGKTLGLAAQGTGLAAKGVAGTAKLADRMAADNVKIYADLRRVMAQGWDNIAVSGEQVLRRSGIPGLADELMHGRAAMHVKAAMWTTRTMRAGADLSKSDRELVGEILHGTPLDEIAKRTKTDVNILAQRAGVVRQVGEQVAKEYEATGVPVFDPRDGSIHRFVPRGDWAMPHVYTDTSKFINEGPVREGALKQLTEQQHMSLDKAKLFLEELHQRNQAEVEDFMVADNPGRSAIKGSVTMMGRRYNLPGFDMDPFDVFPKYLMTAARRIENVTRFGDPARPMPYVADPLAAKNVIERTTLKGGGTFNLDPAHSVYSRPAHVVALAGKAVPLADFNESVVQEVVAAGNKFREANPGLKMTLGTWVDNGQVHVEIGTAMPNRRAALALGNVAKQQSIAKLGRGGTFLRVIPTANKDVANLTFEEAQGVLDKWFETKVGRPFSKEKQLPMILNAKTMYPRAFDQVETIANPHLRELSEAVVARQLGFEHGPQFNVAQRTGVQAAMAMQAVTKLGLAQISQVTQFLTPIARAGYKDSVKDLFRLMERSPELHDKISRSGAALHAVVRQSEESMTGKGSTMSGKMLRRSGFTALDTAARNYSVLRAWSMASHMAERMTELHNRLAKIGTRSFEANFISKELGKIEQKFVDLSLDPKAIAARGGTITEDEFMLAGQKLSADVNFWGDTLSLPPWWTSPWGRIATQFKSFSYQQGKFFKDFILKPAVQDGDIGPLLKFLPAALIGGEVIADLKAALRGKERTSAGTARLIEDLYTVGSFGLIGDTFQGTTDQGRLASQAFGPTAGTLMDGLVGAHGLVTGKPKQLAKTATQLAVPFIPYVGPLVAPAVTNAMFPPKKAAQ